MSGRSTNKRSASPKRASRAPTAVKGSSGDGSARASGPRPKPKSVRETANSPRRASGMVRAVTVAAQHEVERILREVIRPLIEADGGDVDLVSVDESKTPIEISLAVGGAYRGCPGTPLVARSVMEPAFAKTLAKEVRVRIVPRLASRS